MKILMIGSGGREHALLWKIAQNRLVEKMWCLPGNGGISSLAECVPIKATEIDKIVEFAKEKRPDLTVVAPDDPLAMGCVDALEAAGLRAFGPHARAAEIESSKSFAKELMRKYGIPTAKYRVFDDEAAAIEYVKSEGAPIVIKADGLARGKGVTVASSVEEAVEAVKSAMSGNAFGASGARVVVEECMSGAEVSVLCLTDGVNIVPLPSAQDHKRVFDGNRGPNTGGMGAFAPSPLYTPEIASVCEKSIFRPTVDALRAEGREFKGVLYFGLMLTPDGPKVVEYNARFGDPEAQAVLPLINNDLVDLMNACIDGTLADVHLETSGEACACVVLASAGYPGKSENGKVITGLGTLPSDVAAFHAGTARENGKIVTAGGRVLGITACGSSVKDAAAKAYDCIKLISFDGAHYRTDIGTGSSS